MSTQGKICPTAHSVLGVFACKNWSPTSTVRRTDRPYTSSARAIVVTCWLIGPFLISRICVCVMTQIPFSNVSGDVSHRSHLPLCRHERITPSVANTDHFTGASKMVGDNVAGRLYGTLISLDRRSSRIQRTVAAPCDRRRERAAWRKHRRYRVWGRSKNTSWQDQPRPGCLLSDRWEPARC